MSSTSGVSTSDGEGTSCIQCGGESESGESVGRGERRFLGDWTGVDESGGETLKLMLVFDSVCRCKEKFETVFVFLVATDIAEVDGE